MLRVSPRSAVCWHLLKTYIHFQDSCPYLLLQRLQRLKLQSGQLHLDVPRLVGYGERKDKLQSQERVLKSRKSIRRWAASDGVCEETNAQLSNLRALSLIRVLPNY